MGVAVVPRARQSVALVDMRKRFVVFALIVQELPQREVKVRPVGIAGRGVQ
jgi:hypothetical protein